METSILPGPAAAAEPQTTTVELFKNGDAALVVGNKRFIVSSEILKITSDYFKALFSPFFREGQAALNGDCSDIVLHDDDPDAMEIILSILHYHSLDTYRILSTDILLKVAQHCDKYQCKVPLQAWASQWMQGVIDTDTEPEYAPLLLAAYIFRSGKAFEEMSKHAIRNLSLSSGKVEFDAELNMPEVIQLKVSAQILEIAKHIRFAMERAEVNLRCIQSMHVLHHCSKICLVCNTMKPPNANKCHGCNNKDLCAQRCMGRTRSADYFEALSNLSLWPTSGLFEHASIVGLAKKIGRLEKTLRHWCTEGRDCPLRKEIRELNETVEFIVRNITGISIDM